MSKHAGDAFEFVFFDATNLASASESHLTRMRISFLGAQYIEREDVYTYDGREEASVLALERVAP